MNEPTIEIRHELHDPAKPAGDVNRWFWWVLINGKRVVGCYSEHEAEQHRDTAETAWEAGHAAARAGATECFVIWNTRSNAVVGVQRATDTYAYRNDADRLCERLNKELPGGIYEVRPARLVLP